MTSVKPIPLEKNYRSNETTRCMAFPRYPTKVSYGRARAELVSFEGILGAACRSNAGLSPKVSDELTATLFDKSSSAVSTNAPEELRAVLLDLYSGEGKGKIRRFSPQSLTYLKHHSSTHKDDKSGILGFGEFVNDIFLPPDFLNSFDQQHQSSLHLLDQVMIGLLPNLSPEDQEKQFRVKPYFQDSLVASFRADLNCLADDSARFLRHIDDLVRIYLFHYLIGITRLLNKQIDKLKRKVAMQGSLEFQFHYLLEGERASSSRVGVSSGWKSVKNSLDYVFTHINCLQLINHVELTGPGNVHDYLELVEYRDDAVLEVLKSVVTEFCSVAPNSPKYKFKHSAELLDDLEKGRDVAEVVSKTWEWIDRDIQKSEKKSPADKMSNWIRGLGYGSLLQNKAALGYVSVLPLRYVQLIVSLVVRSSEQDRVRLKDLWAGFEARGVLLDEASKASAITHFESIGILETKSDSGDARYVRAPF